MLIRTTFTLIFTLCSWISNAQSHAAPPNVIVIYVDDLGYGDLSSYGGDIPTPNIDRIGEEGIRFTDFYAAPVCTPSRFGLLTGSNPIRSRHDLNTALMPFSTNYLDPAETTLAEYLKSAGYHTALIGKWHLGRADESDSPLRHGFDRFYGFEGGCVDYFYHTYGKLGLDWYVDGKKTNEEGYATDLLTRHAMNYLGESKERKAPFFLYLAYNTPHYGKSDPDSLPANTVTLAEANYKGYPVANTLQAPAGYLERFNHIKDPYRRVYAAMVANLDDNIGRLMQRLHEEGLSENTMIWFISDNGGSSQSLHGHASNGALKGEKGTLWEGGIRVPAMVRWTTRIKPGQVINTPACNLDLVPTLSSIAGFGKALPDNVIDGKDIGPILFHNKKMTRDLFWSFRGQTAIRRGAWKLIDGELYNLEQDPSERNNVAERYASVVRKLEKRLSLWR